MVGTKWPGYTVSVTVTAPSMEKLGFGIQQAQTRSQWDLRSEI